MYSKYILRIIVILGFIIKPFVIAGKSCLKLKESAFCQDFVKDGTKLYIGPSMYKDKIGVVFDSIKDFDKGFELLSRNPVYPAERSTLGKYFGCPQYEPFQFSETNRYVYTYQCSEAINDKVKNCNEKVDKNTIKKICKSTCLLYYEAIKSIFNNTNSCPEIAKQSEREKRLTEIKTHCDTYASEDEDCLLGVDQEAYFCGYRDKDSRNKYCEQNPTEICCSKTREENENNDTLLNICKSVGIGVLILLLVVLVILKIYSTNKNKRDEVSRAEALALERKREEEREKYREQLSKEFADTSIDSSSAAPLLQQINVDSNSSISSPYNAPRPPPPAQNNNPNAVHRPGPPGTPHSRSSPPQGVRDSPRNGPSQPPQHQGSKGPGASPRPQGARDSPRNSPAHPPQHQGSKGPGASPRPPQGARDSPRNSPAHPPQGARDSPRNGPIHPPQHQGSRGSPNQSATNRNDKPQLPSNNNRY